VTGVGPEREAGSVPERRAGCLGVIVTFDSRVALERCLAALTAQTTPPDEVLVVDNASAEPVDDLVAATTNARLLRLPENIGPAGGYAAGLTEFLASGYERAWLVDDDCVPAPDALAAQIEQSDASSVVLATMVDHATREITNTQGWCGVLLPRAIVAEVGVPDAELFWWNEDTEYLQWRIPRAGFTVVRNEHARVDVSRSRQRGKPAWKYYYEARNQVYYRLHTQRPRGNGRVRRPLTRRVRWWRATRSVSRLAVRALVRESGHRVTKFTMVIRGTRDGIAGRLGRTVAVDTPDRPIVSPNINPR
jgi:rhamnopyranosyl-N-acetylglucosaminyl-diphospho-decaprenol beta-1,3/1,4-galactofuranosyltransferase